MRTIAPATTTQRRTTTIAAATLAATALAQRLTATRGTWFYLDDWPIMLQARNMHGILEPYNGHLTVTMLAIYRAHLAVFGLGTYLPLRIVGALTLTAIPVTVYLAARQRLHPASAALIAVPLIWFHHMNVDAAAINLWLSVLGGIGCAVLLPRPSTPRRDVALAAALTFSLCSASSGFAVAAACLAHNACTRPRWQRWAATVGPLAAWAVWWLVNVGHAVPPAGVHHLHGLHLATRTIGNLAGTFGQITLGNRALGTILFIAFAGYVVAAVRQGRHTAATPLAWTAALAVWWAGLAVNRGTEANAALQFRYAYIAAVFAALAVAAPVAVRWQWHMWERPRAATTAVLAAALIVAGAGWGDVERVGRQLRHAATITQACTADVLRGVVPPDHAAAVTMYYVPPVKVRELVDDYGVAGLPDRSTVVGDSCHGGTAEPRDYE